MMGIPACIYSVRMNGNDNVIPANTRVACWFPTHFHWWRDWGSGSCCQGEVGFWDLPVWMSANDLGYSKNICRYVKAQDLNKPTPNNMTPEVLNGLCNHCIVSMKSLLLGNEWTKPTTNCRGRMSGFLYIMVWTCGSLVTWNCSYPWKLF